MSEETIELEIANLKDAVPIAFLTRDEIETDLEWKYRPQRIRQIMQENETVVLVARCTSPDSQRRQFAGFAIMRYQLQSAHLLLLAVAPKFRRRGIATALLKWLEKTALVAGVESILLEVREHNGSARNFYEKLGFRDAQLIHDYYSNSENALRMMRRIREYPSIQPS